MPTKRELHLLSAKEQAALRRALRATVRVIENGHVLEKLRHHRHPRGAHRDFVKDSA